MSSRQNWMSNHFKKDIKYKQKAHKRQNMAIISKESCIGDAVCRDEGRIVKNQAGLDLAMEQ